MSFDALRITEIKLDVNVYDYKSTSLMGKNQEIPQANGSALSDGLEGAFVGEKLGFFAGIEEDSDGTAGAIDADFYDEADAFLRMADAHADFEADWDVGSGLSAGEECRSGGEKSFAAEFAELFDLGLMGGE